MATRRESREWVVQLLFELDMNPGRELQQVFDVFWADREHDSSARAFAEDLVKGITAHRPEIDERMREHADHWSLSRMGRVDRNVMRMAIYEMLFRSDIPPAVSINEAVDIAKYFSSSESGRFVNGILDRVRKELGRPARQAVPQPGDEVSKRKASEE